LNAGHALPTLAEGVIFVAAVTVDLTTLVSMIAAATAGAWLGAGTVSRCRDERYRPRWSSVVIASLLFVATNLHWIPGGGQALD